MHKSNIAILRKEALRLIQVELKTLKQISNVPGLIEQHSGSLTPELISNHISVLQSEAAKLSSLDMVLAVVGTMKAGKSTTINALVGCEVVPNRNEAMTSIPTLIRHKPGHHEPILQFESFAHVNQFVHSIRSRMVNSDFANDLTRLCSEKTVMRTVADFLHTDQVFRQHYPGQESIFEFLKLLNDLVRLSGEMDLDFPFEAFSNIQSFPVIDIEFRTLRERNVTDANFCLLDTPGPNEAGQVHLKAMLQEQLDRASAVLVVLNYGQLMTEADAALRAQIQHISEHAQGRIFVLLNRIDEKSANDPDLATTIANTALNLRHSRVEPEHIHAVSAKCAFLAGITERLMSADSPDTAFRESKWNEEIIRLGEMGRKARRGEITRADLEEAADTLWEDSLFEEGIEDIILKTHANAASIAVESAASKLDDFARKMANFIGGRAQALKTSTQNLQGLIEKLQSEIHAVQDVREHIEACIENSTESFSHFMQTAMAESLQQADNKVESLFQQNLSKTNELIKQIQSQSLTLQQKKALAIEHGLDLKKIFDASGLADELASRNPGSVFAGVNLDQKVIEFSSMQASNDFIKNVESFYAECLSDAASQLSTNIDASIKQLDSEINEGVQKNIVHIIDGVREQLEQHGFSIKFAIPAVQADDAFKVQGHKVDILVYSDLRERIRVQEQSDIWGVVKRIAAMPFNAEWGKDNLSYQEQYFKVRQSEVRDALRAALKREFNRWQEEAEVSFFTPVYASARQFTSEIADVLESVAADLLAGLQDHSNSKEAQDALLSALLHSRQPTDDMALDAAGLLKDSLAYRVTA